MHLLLNGWARPWGKVRCSPGREGWICMGMAGLKAQIIPFPHSRRVSRRQLGALPMSARLEQKRGEEDPEGGRMAGAWTRRREGRIKGENGKTSVRP